MRRCYRSCMTTVTGARIRDARLDDLETINRIYNEAIGTSTATWDEEPWTIEKRQAWFDEHGALSPVLIAEVSGTAVGFAGLTRMSQKSGWRFTREDTIYLETAARGQGIGRLLLAELLERARAIGIRLVVASISSDNAASLALHAGLGFETVGELRNAGYKFGQWQSTMYLQCDLGEPAGGNR